MEAKNVFVYVIAHKNDKKYHLDTIQTSLDENEKLSKGILCENHIFPFLKMHDFRRNWRNWK